MVKYLLLTLVLLFCEIAVAQQRVKITGTVCDMQTKKPVEGVNVILQDISRRIIYGYDITQGNGSFSISCQAGPDSLSVVIKGFNVREQWQIVACRSQQIDLLVEFERVKIKEVVVKAPSVTRRRDTLSYMVAKYLDPTDHTIGDVLRKMPGIEVAKSGEIRYNGRAINKFYVEDMDMLEGRYGIATNNIQARDIAKVEVYENHQPIKALQKLAPTDRAAINLRLKESAKGTWNATLQLGAGYKPWMRNIEATTMYFGRRFQTLNTYKTDNTGDDVEQELTSFYGGLGSTLSILGVHTPTKPSLDKKRYLDNDVHTISVNTVTKLKKELELKANAHYIHDFRTSKGSSITTYYLSGQSPLVIREQTLADQRNDRTEVSLQLNSNTSKHYLQEKFTFSGEWNSDLGRVMMGDDRVDQRFRLPKITIRNRFHNVRQFRKWTLNFNSETDYSTQPTTLRIYPMLYPEVFDTPTDYPNAHQMLDSKCFRTQNRAFTSYSVKRWNFSLNAALNARIERMDSELAPMNARGQTLPTVDTMRNDIYWRKFDLIVGPGISYRIGEKFNASLYVPLDFMSLRTEDNVRGKTDKSDDLIFSPSFSIQSALTVNLKFSARASYQENIGGLYDTYSGFIMTDYRMISSKKGEISRNKIQNYSASFSYGNAIRALFGSFDIRYWRTQRNLMYGTTYEGSLSRIESVLLDNNSKGGSVNGEVSKRFDGISTTMNVSGGFNRSWAEVLRQGKVMQTTYDLATVSFGFASQFTQAVRLDYDVEYSRSRSNIEGGDQLEPIDVVQQEATMNFIIKKKFICRVGCDYYYNAGVGGADRNMFFLDAGLEYNIGRMAYSIEARNLLDTRVFNSASYSDITSYVYSYKLRPASVMFKVKFSLR